ncbi:putative membrane-associated protein/domain [Methanolobus tindarius DSM 2278]|uniref:Putative membrane-associated protein/domain n=1 Tax=Methanolobus tindarius DSM 2278 TaxID=1090322 RepID=W9DRP7_METTI|nr:hypothetical protein [Methanolobus tindarius]ETA68428.1 putative membrane-associated protein/domain [Methanolobus tindarius DSM 2278]
MKPVYLICFIAIILMLTGVGSAANIATVHGVAYEWSTFEPLDNAIIEVNSTPTQSMVAQYGVYSFELANGTYMITASYYEDDQLTYYAEDIITVSEEGSYVLDLLLVPSYSSSNETESEVSNIESSSGTNSNSLVYGSILVIVILLVLLISQMKQKPQSTKHAVKKEQAHQVTAEVPSEIEVKPVQQEEKAAAFEIETSSPTVVVQETREFAELLPEAEEPVEEVTSSAIKTESVPEEPESVSAPTQEPDISNEPVPADLQEILDILKSQGGRMTQKDMRKRLKYSEGKVSLMLLDLEKRGKIQKFKKGRGNVLFLVESEK